MSYEPPEAATTGVTITSNTAVEVNITNDFSQHSTDPGSLALEKTVVNPDGVTLPTNFTAGVDCDDGTSATVTFPNTGGPGTPSPLTPALGATCNIEEVRCADRLNRDVFRRWRSGKLHTADCYHHLFHHHHGEHHQHGAADHHNLHDRGADHHNLHDRGADHDDDVIHQSDVEHGGTGEHHIDHGADGRVRLRIRHHRCGNSNLPTTGANAFPAIIVATVAVACGMLLLLVSLLPLPSGPRPRHRRRRSS